MGTAVAATPPARGGAVSGVPGAPVGGRCALHANMGLLNFGLGRLRTPNVHNGVVNAL